MSSPIKSLRPRLPKVLFLAAVAMLGSGAAAHAATPAVPAQEPAVSCQKGEFCVWTEEFYGGDAEKLDLRTANPEECVPLLTDFEAYSFVNHMDRLVTVYQDGECSTEGDFTTYPGGGTFVPRAPFVVRAIQIWN